MMLRFRPLRYTFTFIGPALGCLAFLHGGWWTWGLPIFAFALVPFAELLIGPDHKVLSPEEVEAAGKDPLYDLLLYAIVPVQYTLLMLFLFAIQEPMTCAELAGTIFSMGILCGNYGINAAHELGHRTKAWERAMSRALLLTSQYIHFYTEHNRGHHRNVATSKDPASSNYKEPVYVFWVRSIVFSYLSAWRIETERLKKSGLHFLSLKNQMLQAVVLQASLVLAIYFAFDGRTSFYYLISALAGILLLETVNYIEHYALKRTKKENGNYHKVSAVHSWNSDHILGRIFMFELSRHSDHHYKSSKKYQLLTSDEHSPQMPSGYPGMMLLSLCPPLFFKVMEKDLNKLRGVREDLEIA